MTTATRERCRHCGGTIILSDEDGRDYCLMCRRPYHDFHAFGRMGGLQTYMRHGREHMVEIGRRGGRPRLRQLPVPIAQIQFRGGGLPNSLKGLKELYRLRNNNGGSSARN